YRFGHIEPGEHKVSVDAQDYLNRNVRVVVGPGPEPAEIRLTSMEESRREYEQVLATQWDGKDGHGPNDFPEKWLMKGVFVVGAAIAVASLISRRWRVRRRLQRPITHPAAGRP